MSTSYQQRLGFYKGDRYIHHLGEENARRTSVFNALSNKRERDDNKIKSQMCSNLPNCKFGDKCRFAHSKDELRKPLCKFGDTCRFKDTCTFDHSPGVREVIPKREKTPSKPSIAKDPKERNPPTAPKENFVIELEDSDEEEEEKEQIYAEEEELIPTPNEKEKFANVPNSPTLHAILEGLAKCYRSDDEVEEEAMKKIAEEAATAKTPKKITAAETENPVIQQAIRQPCGVLLPDVVPIDISEVKESYVEEKSFGNYSVTVEPEVFLSSDENIIDLHPQEIIMNEALNVQDTKNEQENVEEHELNSGGNFSDVSPFCQVLESPFYPEEYLMQTTLAEVFSDQETAQHHDDLIYPELDDSFHNFTLGPSLYESLKHESTQELVQQIINQQKQIQIQQQKLDEQQTIIDSQTQILYTPSIPIIVSPSLFYFIQHSGF